MQNFFFLDPSSKFLLKKWLTTTSVSVATGSKRKKLQIKRNTTQNEKMRLIDIIKKYGFQATTGTITILAYKDAIYTHKAELEKAKLRSMQDEKALENLHTFLVERTTPIRIKANQVAEKEKELEKLTNQIKEYKDKIDNKLLGTHENENTMNLMIDYWTNEKKNLKVEIDKTGSEITSIING